MPTIFKELNGIDIFFLILLLGMIYKGVRSGVAGQIVPLVGAFVLIFVSVGYYKSSSEAFFGSRLQAWAKPVSFFLICVLVFFVFKIIEKLFNFKASEDMAMIERLAGLSLAVLRTLILCGAVSLCLFLMPSKMINNVVKVDSKSALKLAKLDIDIYCFISELVNTNKTSGKKLIVQEIIGNIPNTINKTSGEKNET